MNGASSSRSDAGRRLSPLRGWGRPRLCHVVSGWRALKAISAHENFQFDVALQPISNVVFELVEKKMFERAELLKVVEVMREI